MTRWKRSISNGSHLSVGSRGVSLTESSVETLLMIAIRLMPSVPSRAAREMLTRLAICCACLRRAQLSNFEGAETSAPGEDAAREQQGEQEEGAPEEA